MQSATNGSWRLPFAPCLLLHGTCRTFQVAATTKRSLPFALTFRPFAELPEQSLLLCGCLSRNAAAVVFRAEQSVLLELAAVTDCKLAAVNDSAAISLSSSAESRVTVQ